MEFLGSKSVLIVLILRFATARKARAFSSRYTALRNTHPSPIDKKAKICYLNCDSPICKAECKGRKPNCEGPGSACMDPRFIGGDGIVFYFHGKKNEYFSLALGLLFGSNSFSVEASQASSWDDETDHLKFTYNGEELVIPESQLSAWQSPENAIRVERTSSKNSVLVTLQEVAEISVNVVPVTKEDDRIRNYQIPSDDCFAHLEVQFRFYGLSSNVERVLGRTYQPDFRNPAKPGVAMPVVGGEHKYRTTSLVSVDCTACVFTKSRKMDQTDSRVMNYGNLDCTGNSFSGNGIVCRK
ncbi:hypothetical protein ACFX1Q_008246 [Malus domestica]